MTSKEYHEIKQTRRRPSRRLEVVLVLETVLQKS